MSAENVCVGVNRQYWAKFRIEEVAPFQFMEVELKWQEKEFTELQFRLI